MLTLAALPWTAAQRAPHAAVLRLDGTALDAATLDRAAAGAAAALERLGVGHGHRVAICCGNGFAFPALFYGALRREAVVAPISTAAPPAEIAQTLRRLRVRVLTCDAEHEDLAARACALLGRAAPPVLAVHGGGTAAAGRVPFDLLTEHPAVTPRPVPPGLPAVILATSGTTGTPRRAVHSHTGLLLNARAVAGEMLGLGEDDVQLGALPLAHSFGMSAVLNASLLAGASVALMRRFDPEEALRVLAEERVTVLQAVPTMFSRLVAAAGDRPAALRTCVVSGAPLPVPLATAVHRHLCDTVIERYGMTEVSPLTMRRVPRDAGQPGDVGRPVWGATVRVAGGGAEGELEATAPSMFLGYDRDPTATTAALQDGFFRTGDLGRVEADGRVLLTGRLKDVIVRGGHNVAAREVERVLEGHPAVVEAAVVGVPDSDLGEEVAAALVVRGDPEAVVAELRERCAQSLTAWKRPRHWHVVTALPRTASGKVRKEELRGRLS